MQLAIRRALAWSIPITTETLSSCWRPWIPLVLFPDPSPPFHSHDEPLISCGMAEMGLETRLGYPVQLMLDRCLQVCRLQCGSVVSSPDPPALVPSSPRLLPLAPEGSGYETSEGAHAASYVHVHTQSLHGATAGSRSKGVQFGQSDCSSSVHCAITVLARKRNMMVATVVVLCCLFVAGAAEKKSGPKVTDMVRDLISLVSHLSLYHYTKSDREWALTVGRTSFVACVVHPAWWLRRVIMRPRSIRCEGTAVRWMWAKGQVEVMR